MSLTPQIPINITSVGTVEYPIPLDEAMKESPIPWIGNKSVTKVNRYIPNEMTSLEFVYMLKKK